jgi:hypothetical protein
LSAKSSFIVKPLLLHDRMAETIYERGDFISVDIENTTADLSKVWVKFDNSPFWLRLSDYYDTEVYFSFLTLKWDKSEVGKSLYLVIGRGARFRKYRGTVTVVGDLVNLASNIVATDYDLLVLNLGVERVDVLIATNVISLTIVSATAGAKYSIKLFSPAKPALDQNILTPGTTIERLNRANVYLTNPPQLGSTLTILVLRG